MGILHPPQESQQRQGGGILAGRRDSTAARAVGPAAADAEAPCGEEMGHIPPLAHDKGMDLRERGDKMPMSAGKSVLL